MHYLSVDELLERVALVANLAMLRTYAGPSPIQIASIKEFTPLLESKLRSLPPSDTPTRDRILAQLSIHRSILAPIRRLPVEILSELFVRVQKSHPLRTLRVAIHLSHVCFSWRDVAHGHAALWTKVVVEAPDDFDEYCKKFLPMTREVPLELRCDDREILGDLWDCIAPYASRWRRIKLEGCLRMFPDLKVLYMENLERLVVDAYDAPISQELSALDFVVAPRLRHIGITIDVLQSERQLHVPAMQALTSLSIEAMSPFPVTYVLPLLKACANTLRLLTLKVRHPLDDPEGSYPTSTSNIFVMKALTFLSLVDPACALLNHITTPLIDELILSNVPEYGTRSLLGFLTRSHATYHLKTLRVYKAEDPDVSAWTSCIRLMGSVTALHFDDLLSKRQFLENLFPQADTPLLLPSLKALALFGVWRKHPELRDVIGKMCASRAKPKPSTDGRRGYKIFGWIEESEEEGIRYR